mgnify:FL=1
MIIKKLKDIAQDFSILYAEDDNKLRESTSMIFKDLFKEAVFAKDGLDALSLYK